MAVRQIESERNLTGYGKRFPRKLQIRNQYRHISRCLICRTMWSVHWLSDMSIFSETCMEITFGPCLLVVFFFLEIYSIWLLSRVQYKLVVNGSSSSLSLLFPMKVDFHTEINSPKFPNWLMSAFQSIKRKEERNTANMKWTFCHSITKKIVSK